MKTKTHPIRNRLIAMLLCIVMVAGMIPMITSAADTDSRLADPSTMARWMQYFGPDALSTLYAGAVWTDKSVFTDNSALANAGVTMSDAKNNFLVALSALASTKEITGYASLPTDTMLVLDVSGSLQGTNARAMVNATNAAIHELMSLSKYNRVGVVLYSGNHNFGNSQTSTGKVILPLDHYSTTATTTFTVEDENGRDVNKTVGAYLDITGSGDSQTVSINEKVLDGKKNPMSDDSKAVRGGTYIQNGLYQAWEEFERVSKDGTVIAPNNIQGGTQRLPIVVLMSDGEPTVGTDSYNDVGTSNLGSGRSCTDQIAFVTQLTAAWVSSKVMAAYNGTAPLFYTLGLGTENSNYATAILNPSSMRSNSTLRTYWDRYLTGTPDRNGMVTISGSGNNAWKLEKDNAITSYQYVKSTNYWLAQDAADLISAFDSIVHLIKIQTEYYPTLVVSGEREIDGYISFEDDLGEFMEVKDIKGIVIGDVLFSGEEMASALDTGILGTPSEPTDLGNEFVWTVMERLGIADVSVAQQLINAAFLSGQLSKTDSNYSNYIGWYADADGNFLGHWDASHDEDDYPVKGDVYSADAAYINRSYGYLGKTGVGNIGKTDMMHIVVQVHTEIATGRQSVIFSVPAALIPMVTYRVTLDRDTIVDGQTGTMTYEAADPIQLVFEVGLRSDINPVNVDRIVGSSDHYHYDPLTGEYEFYTNRWGSINTVDPAAFDYTDPFSHLVTVSDFRPSLENERYYFIEDSAIFTDRNGTKYLGSNKPTDLDANSDHSGYYSLRYVIEATGSNDRAVVKAVYEPIHDISLRAATLKDNTYVIPAGTVRRTINQNNIKKDDPSTTMDADGNFTDTLEYSSHPYLTGDQTSNYTVYTFLGNNGKLALKPAAGIALTKAVTEDIEGVEAFTFTVTNVPEGYLLTDADGNPVPNVAAQRSGTTLTLTIPAGQTVYITGLAQGSQCTITEATGNYKLQGVTVGGIQQNASAPVTVSVPTYSAINPTAPLITPVVFTNAPLGQGSLIVSKDVNYPEGFAPAAVHNDKAFTVKVTFNGDVTGITAPAGAIRNGSSFTLSLKDGQSAIFSNIQEGITYTVEELDLSAGYTLNRIDYTNTTIESDAVAQAHVVNDYRLQPVSPNITVQGTKIVQSNDPSWPAGAAFNIQLWQVTDPANGTLVNTNLSATVTEANPDYSFDMSSLSFTTPGTYYFRIVEEIPDEADRIANMAYDRSYGLFTITVTDTRADGQLEITEVHTYQDTTLTTSSGGWIVEKDFHNVISTDRVYLDIQKHVVDADDANLTYSDKLADITFGVFSAMRYDNIAPSYYVLTDANGKAQLMIPVSKEDIAQTQNNRIVLFLREIAPAVENRVIGMNYDESWIYAIAITWDDASNQAVVSYAPIADGQIGAYSTYTEGSTVFEHTNTYEKNVTTEFELSGNKTLNGNSDLGGREFSFSLYTSTAAFVHGDTPLMSVKNNGNAIHFRGITITEPGMHYFVVKENASSLGGITTDTAEYHITVLVEKFTDTNGTTRIRVANGYPTVVKYGTNTNVGTDGLHFDNTYTVSPVPFAISGHKVLTGNRVMEKGDFTFELFDASGASLGTATNNANGNFTFNAITYTAAGTYIYTVKEVKGSLPGITYDETEYTVSVKVTDNGDGTLSASATYGAENSSRATLQFNNSYKAESCSITLSGTKTLVGRPGLALQNEEFTFALYESNADFSALGTAVTTTNDATGKFSFTREYETPGTRYYILREDSTAAAPGIHYSTLEYRVTVSVSDAGTGKLSANVTASAYGLSGSIASNQLNFTNAYRPTATAVTLEGTKVVKDQITSQEQIPAEGSFTFELYNAVASGNTYVKDGNAIQTKKNDAQGKFVFDEIPFTEAGTYRYIVTEYNDGQYDIRYDETSYLVTVVVKDNLEGALKVDSVTVTGGEANSLRFVNIYDPSMNSKAGQVIIQVTKTIDKNGYDHVILSPGGYTFKLEGVGHSFTDTVISADNGKASFTLNFTQSDIGKTFVYKLTEVTGDKDDIIYSTREHQITVTVGVDGTELTTQVYVDTQLTTQPAVTFTNIYDPKLTDKELNVDVDVSKNLVNNSGTDAALSGFKFKLSDGTSDFFATSDKHGKAAFRLHFTEQHIGSTFTYTLSEVDTEIDGMTYDETVYTYTVAIGVDADGKLVATFTEGQQRVDALNASFTNTYDGPPPPPITGDNTQLALLIVLMIVSAASMAVLTVVGKKRFF